MKNRFRKAFSEYLSISTVHGLKYLNERRSKRMEKIFWAFALILVSIGFILMISETTEKFFSEKIVIRLSKREHLINEIPFPAVTICPGYAFPADLIELITRNKLEYVTDHPERAYLIELLYDQDILRKFNVSPPTNKSLFGIMGSSITSHTFWFLKNTRSYWLDEYRIPFNSIFTKYGLCFNFNLMPAEELLNNGSVSKDFSYENHWYYDWIQIKRLNESFPWRISRAGTALEFSTLSPHKITRFGFHNTNPFEVAPGIRVSIHNTDELPSNPKQSFFLKWGYETNAIIEPQVTLADDDLRSMSYEKRGCYFTGEKPLKSFKVYTKTNCEQEVLSIALVQMCGCAPFYLIRAEDKVCGVADRSCVARTEYDFNSKRSQTECLDSCETINYQVKLAKTSDSHAWKLNLIYKSNRFYALVKHRAYSLTDYVAAVGGLLGLLAGISVMSFVEVSYHLSSALMKKVFVKVHPEIQTRSLTIPERNKFTSIVHQCSRYFLHFMNESSIHGFNYMTNRKLKMIEKLFWITCVIVSGYFCVDLVIGAIKHAELNPTTIGIDSKVFSSNDISFPGITFCPEINQRKYRALQDCLFRKLCVGDDIILISEMIRSGTKTLHCGVIKEKQFRGKYCLVVESQEKARESAMDAFENFMEYDWIEKQSFCMNQHRQIKLSPVFTSKGLCFTLGSNLGILRQNVVSKDFFSNNSMVGECRISDEEFLEKSLSIDISANRSSRSLMFERIIIHRPDEIPTADEVFFEPLGKKTLFVNPKIITTDESLRNISPQRRNCYFPDEKRLRFYTKYSRENCLSECRSNVTLDICNCVPFYAVRDNETTLCLYYKNLLCYISQNVTRAMFETCDCLPDCNSIEYNYELFSDKILGHELLDPDIDDYDPRNDSMIVNARILVRFGSDEFLAYKRYPSYGVVDLTSNVGGLLGLFLGISMFSLIEIVYFFTLRLISTLVSKRTHYRG